MLLYTILHSVVCVLPQCNSESIFSQYNFSLVVFFLRGLRKLKVVKRSRVLVGKWALSFSLNKRSKGSLCLGSFENLL